MFSIIIASFPQFSTDVFHNCGNVWEKYTDFPQAFHSVPQSFGDLTNSEKIVIMMMENHFFSGSNCGQLPLKNRQSATRRYVE